MKNRDRDYVISKQNRDKKTIGKGIQEQKQTFQIKKQKQLYPADISQYRCQINIGIAKSGKSQLAIDIIHTLANKQKTQIFFFTSLGGLDEKVQNLIKEGYNVQFYDQHDMNKGGFAQLYDFLLQKRQKELDYKKKREEKKIDQPKDPYEQMLIRFGLKKKEEKEEETEEEKKIDKQPYKEKYIKNFIIIDDMVMNQANQMQFQIMAKTYRHIKSFIINNIQSFVQLQKSFRELHNIFAIFGGQSDDRLELIHKQIRSDIPLDVFILMYKDAVSKPFHFLLIDQIKLPIYFGQSFKKTYHIESYESESE